MFLGEIVHFKFIKMYTDEIFTLGDYFSDIMPQVDYFLPELGSQAGHDQTTIEFDNSLSFSVTFNKRRQGNSIGVRN